MKAAEDTLSDASQTGSESNNELKNAFFYFVEFILTNPALKRALNYILDRNI